MYYTTDIVYVGYLTFSLCLCQVLSPPMTTPHMAQSNRCSLRDTDYHIHYPDNMFALQDARYSQSHANTGTALGMRKRTTCYNQHWSGNEMNITPQEQMKTIFMFIMHALFVLNLTSLAICYIIFRFKLVLFHIFIYVSSFELLGVWKEANSLVSFAMRKFTPWTVLHPLWSVSSSLLVQTLHYPGYSSQEWMSWTGNTCQACLLLQSSNGWHHKHGTSEKKSCNIRLIT